MPNENIGPELRPLGLLEQHATALHTLGYYNNLATSAFYSSTTTTTTTTDWKLHHIHHAVTQVIASHPVLTAIPNDSDPRHPHFTRLPQIDLQHAVKLIPRKRPFPDEGSDDDELDEVLEAEHGIDFKARFGELPFWRLIVLYEPTHGLSRFYACFITHHAIGDGLSGLAFHRSFLSALLAIQDTPHDAESFNASSYIPPQSPLIPPLESLHPLPTSLPFILRTALGELLPRSRSIWTASPSPPLSTHSPTRLKTITFPASTTSSLVTIARANSTTLTSLFSSLLSSAFFAHLPEHYTTLRAAGVISLRDSLPPQIINANAMGTFVSGYVTVHARLPASTFHLNTLALFNDARAVRRVIEAERAKRGADARVGLLRYAGDLYSFFRGNVGRARGESFEISNLGRVGVGGRVQGEGKVRGEQGEGMGKGEEGEGEAWKLGRCVFSQTANWIGCAVQVTLVTGGDGCLSVGFSWREGVVSEALVEGVVEGVREFVGEVVA